MNLQTDTRYFAEYSKLVDITSEESSRLASNMSVVGSDLSLMCEIDGETGLTRIKVSVKAGPLGYVEASLAEKIITALDEGWLCNAYLSLVAYTEETSRFWGEVAFICYKGTEEELSAFAQLCATFASRIASGKRPAVSLSHKEIESILKTGGSWTSEKIAPALSMDRGTVVFKRKRGFTDSLVTAAANGALGCKIAAVIFWLVVLGAVIVFLLNIL